MVKITKNRMLVNVMGVTEGLLLPIMSYTHRGSERVPMWEGRGGFQATKEVPTFELRKLYKQIEDGSFVFQHGLLDRLISSLKKHNMPYEVVDVGGGMPEPDYDNLRRLMPDLVFRPGQDVIISLVTALQCGQIVGSAGVGKTLCITALCCLYPHATIVVATPGAQLAKDTYARISSVLKYEVGLVGAGSDDPKRITVSTYNSLCKIPPAKVDIVFVDESHRAAQDMLTRPLSSFAKASKVFGFTATPEGRSDNAELVIEALLGPVRVNIPYERAVESKAVIPMKVLAVPVAAGPSQDGFSTAVAKKRNLYWKNLYRNRIIAAAVTEYAKPGNVLGIEDPQVLILVETTAHAEQLSKLLPDYTLVYKSTGRTKLPPLRARDVSERFEKFQSGELRRVIATSCWGTGVDFPELDIVVPASGKSGPIDVVQHTGRCTRVGSGRKEFGYVVDFDDRWCPWASNRYKNRLREYKRMKWEVIT